MKARLLVVFSALVGIPGLLLAQEGGPVLLRYAYPPGKQVIYKNKGRMLMSLGGISAEGLSEYKSAERLARPHEGGSFGVAVVLSDIRESTLVAGHLIQREVLGLLAGDEFGFSLTPTGTLRDFVRPSLKNLYVSERDAMQATITNLELGYVSLFHELPERPVRVGDSWTSEREYKANYDILGGIEGSALLSSTHRIKKAVKKDGFQCFEIEEETQGTSRAYLNFGEISVIAEGTGNVTGKWLFDYERGLVRKYESQTKMDLQAIPVGVPDAKPRESKATAWFTRELEEVE